MARISKADLIAQGLAAGLPVDESMTVAQLTEIIAANTTPAVDLGELVGTPATLVIVEGRPAILVGHRGGPEPAWQVLDLDGLALRTLDVEPAPFVVAAF